MNRVGFSGLLTIVFIVLKLIEYIAWSWVWVLSPLWIEFIVVVASLSVAAVIKATVSRHCLKQTQI